MIFSENNVSKPLSGNDIASLIDWWSLAGVDLTYSNQPQSLLIKNREKLETLANVEAIDVQKQISETSEKSKFPEEFTAFLQWLQSPANLIESKWAQKFAFPEGSADSDLVIISAMPESVGQDSTHQFDRPSRLLLQNMMKALGRNLDQSLLFPLSLGKPVDGQIPESDILSLVERASHLISIVQPRYIILLGDTVSRAFLNADLLTARKKKQYINHVSSKTEAIVTFHPRILLERPELKTEAWKDLQQLTRIGAQ